MKNDKINSSKDFILINPPLIFPKDDYLGSGIVYMPINLAQINAILLNNNFKVEVLDLFAMDPFNFEEKEEYVFQGKSISDIEPDRFKNKNIILYIPSVMSFIGIKIIIESIKNSCKDAFIMVIENTQAVIGFSLRYVEKELYDLGADLVIKGEAELFFNDGKGNELDELPFPEWQGFHLQNYWKLGYAHGPLETGKYISILTSRGCSFNCAFCSIPSMNDKKWRGHSAEYVFRMMKEFNKRYGVREFHIEDVNATIDKARIEKLSDLIIDSDCDFIIKFVSGTKIETITENLLFKLKAAGCNYISFSPESGSPDLLKQMNKPFDYEYGLHMLKIMNKLHIYTQACFVLGFPGESKEDIKLTFEYLKKIVKAGLDEVAVFIVAPMPGTEIFTQFSGYSNLSQLTFSSTWRKDYQYLSQIRKTLYYTFILYKLLFNPLRFLSVFANILQHKFKTKMEMTFYRIFFVWRSRLKCFSQK